ncbi:Uncharacterised protein [Yersinia frederiksenii]|nr:Uncharacterised protein [Yersinia frederiksenii]
MIIYYGVIGTSKFGIDDTGSDLWDGWVVMSGVRPDNDYYASENGEWVLGPSPTRSSIDDRESYSRKIIDFIAGIRHDRSIVR